MSRAAETTASAGPAAGRSRGPALAHRPALDGVRALAVAAVLLHHARVPGIRAGFVGVDVFFTLSGFLITSLLLVEVRDRHAVALGAFWLRRARRLLPALFAVVLAVAVSSPWWMDPVPRATLARDGLAALFYVENWRALASGSDYFAAFGPPSALAHTWSLSVEEQFYLLWPLVLGCGAALVARCGPRAARGLRRLGPVLLLAGLAGSALLTVAYARGDDPMRAYYGTDARAQELLAGALLAVLAVRRGWWAPPGPRSGAAAAFAGTAGAADGAGRPARRALPARPAGPAGLLGLAGLGAVVVLVRDPVAFLRAGGFALVAGLTVLVLAAATVPAPSMVSRLLSRRPLVALGTISYGVYLWHWPVYLLLDPVRTGLDGGGTQRLLLTAARVGVTLLAAVASYRLLERPVRRADWSRLDPASAWLAPTAAVSACVAALVLVPVLAPVPRDGVPEDTVAAGAAVPTSAAPDAVPSAGGRQSLPGPTGGEAPTGAATTGPLRVFVLGDSTAWNLHAQFPPRDPALVVTGSTQLGCDLLGGELVADGVRLGTLPACRTWPRTWQQQVEAARPDVAVVVVGNGFLFDRRVGGRLVRFGSPDYRRLLDSWLDDTVDRLSAASGHVVVTDLPCFRKRDTGLDGTAAVVNDATRQHLVNTWVREHLAAARPDVRVLDLRAAFCPGDTYRPDVDGVRLRTDGVHWSRDGARLVWRWLAAQLRA